MNLRRLGLRGVCIGCISMKLDDEQTDVERIGFVLRLPEMGRYCRQRSGDHFGSPTAETTDPDLHFG